MPEAYYTNASYKTVVLVGGELNDIQVVVKKDQKMFEAVVPRQTNWELRYYLESTSNPSVFVLQQ